MRTGSSGTRSTTCTSATGSDTRLACGLQGYKFITAAEIIRHTGAPWSQAQINTCSNFVRTVLRILYALTEPVFRPIRKIIPPMGGLDLSPIVVFVIIWFLQYTIQWASFRYGL